MKLADSLPRPRALPVPTDAPSNGNGNGNGNVLKTECFRNCKLLGHPFRLLARVGLQNRQMTDSEKLPDAELASLAAQWRQRVLQGDLTARGVAHELEAELRRRSGVPFPEYDTLDLRSHEQRRGFSWWRIWRRRNASPALTNR